MTSPVDISALKARVKQQEEPAGVDPRPAAPVAPTTPPELVKKFVREFEEINSASAADVDPATAAILEATRLAEEQDQVRYRNTPSDNRAVRLAIEARCKPMDFGDLILSGRVSQLIPIIPDKLEPALQSLIGKEVYWLERSAHVYGGNSNMAVASWLGYARLAMSLTELNGVRMQPHISAKDGTVVDDEVVAKVNRVLDLPERLLELLLINYTWFGARVEDLYRHDFKLLKNG